MSYFSVNGLQAHYGKSHILHGVAFTMGKGEILALLGRNGSGRSTAMKAIMGVLKPTAGQVRLNGQDIAGLASHRINRAGIAYVPEERLVFDELTVEENLLIGQGAEVAGRKTWKVSDMYDYFPRLKERQNVRAGSISGGEQQMLTLCRSLMGNPELLLIDEPTEGLAPKIVDHLAEVIADVNAKSVACILVEQKMTVAMRLCERCLVMGHGKIVFDGATEALMVNADIRSRWLEVA